MALLLAFELVEQIIQLLVAEFLQLGDGLSLLFLLLLLANHHSQQRNSFNNNKAPRYLFPVVGYNTFANDLAPVIAPPGRFPGDIASQSRPNQESWMDLGGNMIEWSGGSNQYYGWTGSSFEGHRYPRMWSPGIYFLDKYGKGGSRCIHLK